VTNQPIKYLIYSHHHFDHIAGGKAFKDAGARVIAHKRAKERLDVLKDPHTVPVDEVAEAVQFLEWLASNNFTFLGFRSYAFPKLSRERIQQAIRERAVALGVPVITTVAGALAAVSGMEAQARQTMENIRAVLQDNGLTFADIFKCTVMLADMAKWDDFNKIYVTYFDPDRLPARSAFGTNGLALGAEVELECLAYAGKA